MSGLAVPLSSIRPAFQGVIPTPIVTVSGSGVPHTTYLSVVWYLDEQRIAISNQFLGRTSDNLHENPRVAMRVVDPTSLAEYEIHATRLRTERAGETYDAVRAQLEAVAAQSGMSGVFRLRAIEVLQVDVCESVGNPIQRSDRTTEHPDVLTQLDIFIRRLSECRDLAEATRVGLESLEDLFGLRHSILLMADADHDQQFVVATNGYAESGVGAEISGDEGLIGVAARRRRQVRVASVKRAKTFAAATRMTDDVAEIPLPGLDDAESVVATPLVVHDRLVGVLYLDSHRSGRFDASSCRLVEVIAGHLATTLALLEAGGLDPVTPVTPAAPTATGPTMVAFYERDGSVLIDGDYVIKGVPGRILRSMLLEFERSGRTVFTNREIRLDRSTGLPAGNDNLEARLLTLRRRLEERGGPFRLDRVGRGRLSLTVAAPFDLIEHDD